MKRSICRINHNNNHWNRLLKSLPSNTFLWVVVNRLCQTLNKLKQTSLTTIYFILYETMNGSGMSYEWELFLFQNGFIKTSDHRNKNIKRRRGKGVCQVEKKEFLLFSSVKFRINIRNVFPGKLIIFIKSGIRFRDAKCMKLIQFQRCENVWVCSFDKSQSFFRPKNNHKSSSCRWIRAFHGIAYEIISAWHFDHCLCVPFIWCPIQWSSLR